MSRDTRTSTRGRTVGLVESRAPGAVGTTQPTVRRRSQSSQQALDAFAHLRRFFARDAYLARALGWGESTAAAWRDGSVVRPQRLKVTQVILLDELARGARAYLDDDASVGEWLNAPLPNLRGKSPAQWLGSRGWTGLRELMSGMVDWMPRFPEDDLDPIDDAQVQAFLDDVEDKDPIRSELRRMVAAAPRSGVP